MLSCSRISLLRFSDLGIRGKKMLLITVLKNGGPARIFFLLTVSFNS